MLAVPNKDDDNDPFLTSDDYEDELDTNKPAVEVDTDWLHLVAYFLAQAVYCTC